MQDLVEHVEQSIRERKLLSRGSKVLIAVSGGLDSMVLLHVLHELAPLYDLKLSIAHFNHQLRGRASDADERFVAQTASKLGLPVVVESGAVKSAAKQKKISIEMAARELRHQFLAKTAQRLNCPVVALAHHANDQVELFLLRLLRGAGGEGLAGMKWHAASPVDKRVRIIRPLLDVTRDAIEQFAQKKQIRYRTDASNDSVDILRNRVRHELLPLLRRRFQPAVDRAIVRIMDVVGADAEIASEAARSWLKLKSEKRRFAAQPIGLQRRINQLQLREQSINAEFELIELLRRSPGQPVTVSPGLGIQCDATGCISRVTAKSRGFQRKRAKVQLCGRSGLLEFGDAQISWSKIIRRGAILGRCVSNREIFDADRVGAHIVLRQWQPGDRFQPIGMPAAVKLQDWFTNRKIPHERRRELIVATTALGEIFWIEGERIGEKFKLTPKTRRGLIWHWKRA